MPWYALYWWGHVECVKSDVGCVMWGDVGGGVGGGGGGRAVGCNDKSKKPTIDCGE